MGKKKPKKKKGDNGDVPEYSSDTIFKGKYDKSNSKKERKKNTKDSSNE